MRWIHHRRFGSCLALAALALQFVMSFADVCRYGVHGPGPPLTLASSAAHAARSLTTPQQPGTEQDDEYCAICATIYLVANSSTPSAPQLRVPLVSRTIEHRDRVAVLVIIAPQRLPFQSRAPPLA